MWQRIPLTIHTDSERKYVVSLYDMHEKIFWLPSDNKLRKDGRNNLTNIILVERVERCGVVYLDKLSRAWLDTFNPYSSYHCKYLTFLLKITNTQNFTE